MTTKSFRFLDLPQELQDHIYRHHLQVVSITITDNRYDEEGNHVYFQFHKLPELVLERVCKAICKGSRDVRRNLWPRRLIIKPVAFLEQAVHALAENHKYRWLHGHVDTIEVHSYHPLSFTWAGLARACPKLQSLDLFLMFSQGYLSYGNVHIAHAFAKSGMMDSDYIPGLSIPYIEYTLSKLRTIHGEHFSIHLAVHRQHVLYGESSDGGCKAFTETLNYMVEAAGVKILSTTLDPDDISTIQRRMLGQLKDEDIHNAITLAMGNGQ